jgi:hypothetical protein
VKFEADCFEKSPERRIENGKRTIVKSEADCFEKSPERLIENGKRTIVKFERDCFGMKRKERLGEHSGGYM